MTHRIQLIISGRVQGVFFRKFTQQKADEYGVCGTVRNLEDGRVEVIAQAEADTLKNFIACCRQGPIMARVDEVEIIELATDEEVINEFAII